MIKKLTLLGITAATVATAAAIEPLWLRDIKIAPKGDRIAFTYRGDIYTVPTAGGSATRLTTDGSYNTQPVWSPDGTKIAYASNRHGNNDIYIAPSTGGTPVRLTTNSANELPECFTPDGKSVLFSAFIQDPATSASYPSGRMTELYSVPATGGATTQVNVAPMQRAVYSPDGLRIYYQLRPGMENEWRKHHTSAVTADIWVYDTAAGTHTNLTSRPGEDRDPALSPDGRTLYFLSERDGVSFNVYSAPLADIAAAQPLTTYSDHPVRFLSAAADGTLAYGWDGAIYTLTPGAQPTRVNIDITLTDPAENTVKLPVSLAGGSVSPDGKQLAFASRGDIFVTSVEYPTTKRITATAANDRQPVWGADNHTLYFTGEEDGHANLYRATIAAKDEPDFVNSSIINIEPLFDNDGIERSHPQVSPDGKKLAFIQNRNRLMVMDIKSKKVKQVTDGSTWAHRTGGFDYTWAPDSRWLALEVVDNRHDPYTDIAIVDSKEGTYHNLTQSAYTNSNPRFVMDGNAVIYSTEQYGMRAQASWGSQQDIMITFLNRQAQDTYNLNEEDLALYKESLKKNSKKKDEPKDSTKTPEPKTLNVEANGLQDRTARLTPFSTDLSDAFLDADAENLYFLAATDKGYDLWKMNLRKREPKIVNKTSLPYSWVQLDKSGKTAYIMGSSPKKLTLGADKLTAITARGTMTVDLAAERAAMLDNMQREERERFYTTDMHGVDWDNLVDHYRRFLPHIANNDDYAEMLSEILGELNVSHTGASCRSGFSSSADRTSSLGLLYDMTWNGNGLKVDEIVTGSPFDNATTRLDAGSVITAINGTELTPATDMSALLNDLSGKKTLVTFKTSGGKTVSETIRPISTGSFNSLMYNRWVQHRAADVERLSGGRLGYVHIPSMNDASFRPMYSDLLGKYNTKEGVVIDIRFNGGGRMHEDIEQLFTGQKYLTQVIRGTESCDMPSRRWNKPSIMLQCESCYSNAHGTPWVYKHQGIGRLVGTPVAGTMTSVNWVGMQDPSLTYGIPVIGYRLEDGSYLENKELYPDITVYNDPVKLATGEDTQLKTAVEALLQQIDAAK